MKRITLFNLVLLGAAAMGLSACGGGGGSSSTTTTTTPTPTSSIANGFGAQFATDFQANPNSAPVKPAVGDIVAVTLTSGPLTLH